ncbi:hypothetical protein SLEP1_g31387 [Rubroshorea leprosula]|uniref:Uncharacterized protein n=1 Tax=Rubroshorea leprosula TaxID=152421 RepID=A0AAV5KAD3_9ROSI|nr:hypothetical protein SLEP1_g31387 [Rubroshorea leprosula]
MVLPIFGSGSTVHCVITVHSSAVFILDILIRFLIVLSV